MQKPFVFTYTNINTYLICPEQMYRRYVKKDVAFKGSPESEFGNEVHSAMEYRIGGKPLPVKMQHWEPFVAAFDGLKVKAEVKLGITAEGRPTGFFDKDVWLRGKADVVAINGTACFLPDWKSGKPREEPLELAVNAMLVHAANPHLRSFTGAYVWLKENRMGVAHDVSDTNSTWAKVNNVVEEIKDSMQSGVWEKKRTPLCAWCDVADCENNTNPKLQR